MKGCIVFVCEFIELDCCLVGPWSQNSEFDCFYVLLLLQTIHQMVKIDPTTPPFEILDLPAKIRNIGFDCQKLCCSESIRHNVGRSDVLLVASYNACV